MMKVSPCYTGRAWYKATFKLFAIERRLEQLVGKPNGYTICHLAAGFFSWHATRHRSRSRHRGDDHRQPRADHAARRADRRFLGTRTHGHDSHGWLGHHSVQPDNSAEARHEHGIIRWAHADSAGRTKPDRSPTAGDRVG